MPSTDRLARYQQKRDFGVTREPRGQRPTGQTRGLSFVVQRHEARRLHYDFRLEWDGVLVSWAVPKGPSLDPEVKRLAMHVEDHPIQYGSFEGTIPAGQYGAGKVAIWDAGTWTPLEDDVNGAMSRGHLKFRLDGERLSGEWILIRTQRGDAGKESWILRKLDDADARAGYDAEDDAAPLRARVAQRRHRAAQPKTGTTVAKGRKQPLPATMSPQLATLVDEPPVDHGWVYEIKYDGYRMLARVERGARRAKVGLVSRNGRDWLGKLPHIVDTLAQAGLPDCWLDGEIIVTGHNGLSDFQALQNALSGDSSDVVFRVFDVLFADGRDLRSEPLSARREVLDALLGQLPADGPVRATEVVSDDGVAAYREACRLGLEGLIGKRLDAPYVPRRSPAWIKLKCRPRQEFVIGGYSEPAGSRTGLGALLVGLYDDRGQFQYAGRVGAGFDVRTLERLSEQLKPLARKRCPFATPPSQIGRATAVHWVEPKLVAEIAFAGWTHERVLRQASFMGLRTDKPARDIHKEKAVHAEDLDAPVVGVRISHPERIIFADTTLRKIDLARYYAAVDAWIMPHLKGRPLSLVRCPQGAEKTCFFQKHVPEAPEHTHQVSIAQKGEPEEKLVVVDRIGGAVGLVQLGAIEFHTWGAREPKIEQPDRITFDLDPDPDLPWKTVLESATLTRALVEQIGLKCFVKTTGGKGLHLVVPIRGTRSWDEVKAFAKGVAEHMESVMPERFVANMAKARRRGKVFVDYLRNGREATAIAAFSARARAGAPVSMTMAWDELDAAQDVREDYFNIVNVPQILADREDPWADYDAQRATLSVAMLKLFK